MQKKTSDETVSLKSVLASLTKTYGEEVVMTGEASPGNIVFIPTGSFILDSILGGGIPEGRCIECYGEASSGKSTLALFIAAQFQKQGKTVAFFDHENAYSEEYAKKLGVDIKKLLFFRPNTAEETHDIIRALLETGEVSLFIVDSVASMVTKTEYEAEDQLKDTMALLAKILSRSLRQLSKPLAEAKATILFLNQVRASFQLYGPKEICPGGKALSFFASIRLHVKKEKSEDKFKGPNDTVTGNTLKISAVKNKCAPPFRTGTIDLYFGTGIDLQADTFAYGVDTGVITKTGNSYSFGEKKLGLGEKQAVESLKKDKDLFEAVKKALKKNPQ